MKTELKYLTAFLAGAAMTVFWEELIEPGLASPPDTDLIEQHREVHDYPGTCVDCRGFSYGLDYNCRPRLQCVGFDRDGIEGFDRINRRAAPPPLTMI